MSKFKDIPFGKPIQVDNIKMNCRRTSMLFNCCLCHFKEKGPHCPQGKVHPLCFASERADKESVYYPESKAV